MFRQWKAGEMRRPRLGVSCCFKYFLVFCVFYNVGIWIWASFYLGGSKSGSLLKKVRMQDGIQRNDGNGDVSEHNRKRDKKAVRERNACQVLNLAVIIAGTQQVQPMVNMLKTILYFRNEEIMLHILSDEAPREILVSLFKTWQLAGFSYELYSSDDVRSTSDDLATLKARLKLYNLVHEEKVLVLDYRLRFAVDIGYLYQEFDDFSDDEIIGMTKFINNEGMSQYSVDLMMMAMEKLEKNKLIPLNIDYLTSSWGNMQDWLDRRKELVHILPCPWLVRLQDGTDIEHCMEEAPKILWTEDEVDTYKHANDAVEQIQSAIMSIINGNGDQFRYSASPCIKINPDLKSGNFDQKTDCAFYRNEAIMKRRTQPYIYGAYKMKGMTDLYDVTLVTHLTLEKFADLEAMIGEWGGPLHAVFYVNDEESMRLNSMARQSTVLRKKRNVVFHAVYKRGSLYPVNYLRNVGVAYISTPYHLVVDIHMTPSRGLYYHLREHIRTDMLSVRTALVVPTFQFIRPQNNLPSTKEQLLKEIALGNIASLKLGLTDEASHVWQSAKDAFSIGFPDDLTVNVVLKDGEHPKFEEYLSDGMNDKVAFMKGIKSIGVKLRKVPRGFFIQAAPTDKDMSRKPDFGRCTDVLMTEYEGRLKANQPAYMKLDKVRQINQPQK